ncbi:NAD-dependent epimerase/dehydratase family protein [Dietzia maris]
MKTVVVVGASGFVGSSVCHALLLRRHDVIRLKAPRLDPTGGTSGTDAALAEVQQALTSCDALVNAAGVSEATGTNHDQLTTANGVLPGALASLCADADVRFVHVSSAAVQGRRKTLDADPSTSPFSPYSESKALGEAAALRHARTCVYRPPGVHGPDRSVTKTIAKLARTRASSVAGDGTGNTAQALIGNVADAIAYLATCDETPPPIVSHPSEGLTTSNLLEALGGRAPRRVPRTLARGTVSVAFAAGLLDARLTVQARRLEMLWFGQQQAESWLSRAGWTAPHQQDAWRELGRKLAHDSDCKDAE